MTPLNIAVIGCGYIGFETALHWKQQGHHITGTTRRPERLKELTKCAEKMLLIEELNLTLLKSLLASNDIILVSVGADRPEEYDNAYLKIAQMIRTASLENKAPKTLIYTGSTSVYGDHKGEWVDEKSACKTQTEQGKILLQTELVYQSLEDLGWQVCILRLAEIYGPQRELSKRLKNIHAPLPGSGQQYTNMVHKYDCRDAIDFALQHKLLGIFNLADDDHPTRKELYHQLAEQLDLPEPQWDASRTSLHSDNKRVSNHTIKSAGFAFKFPHRVLS